MMQTSDWPSAQLSAAAALAESGFLAAGQSLEGAVGILERLTRRFGEYIAELTAQALGETWKDLSSAGAHVAALAEGRDADAAGLDTLAAIVANARNRVGSLLPVPREVEALSLTARVVAGGMGLAAIEFAVFAGSISGAAGLARTSLDGARDALTQVDLDLTAARDEVVAFTRRHSAAIHAIPARLASNLSSLEQHQGRIANAATAAHQQSEQVQRQVAEQIMALQLGDITRQRLEHVQAAAQMLEAPDSQIGRVLAAQLDDTADALAREGERIETGLRELAAAARAIGELGAEVHGTSQAGGFIAALEADIRNTTALFAELSAADAVTDRRMMAVLDAAGALQQRLASVQSVQEDIRILGLNATLKCGRLGAVGQPLAAVAQELRVCSQRFGADTGAVLQDLARLQPVAAALSDPSRRGQHAALARATDALLAPLQRLGSVADGLTDALSQLQADADEVGRLVEAAVAQFAARHALADTLHSAASDLASWAMTEAGSDAILLRIAASYTMAREREVHARFAELPADEAADAFADVLF